LTRFRRTAACLAALLTLAVAPACKRGGSGTRIPDHTPYAGMPYRTGVPSSDARIFLVAGGSDIANFAAEVVSQRELWRKQGVPDAHIACYYAKPTPRAYARDRKQYDALRSELEDCFAAHPAVVNAHLRRAAAAAPPYLYLYITSHGVRSVLRAMQSSGKYDRVIQGLTPNERALLHRPAVGLEAGDGPGLEHPERIVVGHRAGKRRADLLFDPETLAETLSALPAEVPKYVVVQACYSGAFLPSRGNGDRSPLGAVENLTMLTATRFDRPSFGCGSADVSTYFGGAFTRVLARALDEGQDPTRVPWRQVYDDTAFIVETWERVEGERPSHPQMLDTTKSQGAR
jgi:hypothetical protein